MALNDRHSYADNVWTQLLQDAGAGDPDFYITPGSTSMIAELFRLSSTTDVFGYLTLFDKNGEIEIVKVISLDENILSVNRGQGGTTARAWRAGTILAGRLIAEHLDRFIQKGIYRSGAYNPNGVLTGAYTGEKFYQTGPANEQKRWWQNTVSSKWRLLSGSMILEESLDEDEYVLHIPKWQDYSDESYWTPTDCTWDAVNEWWVGSASSVRLTAGALLSGIRPKDIQIVVMNESSIDGNNGVNIVWDGGSTGRACNSYWNDVPIPTTDLDGDLDYIGLDCSIEEVHFRVFFNVGKAYDISYAYEDRTADSNWDTVTHGSYGAGGWTPEDTGGLLEIELETDYEWAKTKFQIVKITASEPWTGAAFCFVKNDTGECASCDAGDVTPREVPCEVAMGSDTNVGTRDLTWYGGAVVGIAFINIRMPWGFAGTITKIEFGNEDLS